MILLIFAGFLVCVLVERTHAGWRLPQVPSWAFRVVAINLAQVAVVMLAGIAWNRWLQGASLLQLHARGMGDWAGAAIAYFIATFVFYWWHRWRHESDLLWRLFHQIHHSAQRIEVITSFYKHPVEMTIDSIIGSVLVYTLLGLSPQAGAIYTAFTAFGEFVYHTNVRTPRWLGWFFQRPEMHRIHHRYAYHRNNYGDIVWWDMLFGTYENPREFVDRCGFDTDKELRLGEMLRWRDVHRDPPAP
ncbi:MAG: sterol desaturase family protein [Proteobacteria bacterium]|nr:sterol desaturase family protein [Pseudomonadota bacterium]